MKMSHKLALILGLISSTIMLLSILMLFLFFYHRRMTRNYDIQEEEDIETSEKHKHHEEDEEEEEELVIFQGGENLTICDVLEASGEVIGKSNCGTLYKASLQRSNSIRLLRFLRPLCCGEELEGTVRFLGEIRHPNLVPLLGFYTGHRGEKLLVHPFYGFGNLAQFIRDGNGKCYNWFTIYRISYGIAKGLEHLHTANLQNKPIIIHGNLKSKNILLDRNFQPYVSDYGLHLLLNPTASQKMLEVSAFEGYKAPELIKMKDANEKSDIYSFGLILLELLSGKEPIIHDHPTSTPGDEDFYLPSLMRNARRISDLFHPAILRKSRDDHEEECILKCFQLAMACCSPSPSLRPNIKQVLWKLEEIVK